MAFRAPTLIALSAVTLLSGCSAFRNYDSELAQTNQQLATGNITKNQLDVSNFNMAISHSHNPAAELAYQISEPVLAPFRKLVPNLGGMDISPIFAFIAIQLIQSYVVPPVAEFAGMPMVVWKII